MTKLIKSATLAVMLATVVVSGAVLPMTAAQAGYDDCKKDGSFKGD